jgi:hypothetical protein
MLASVKFDRQSTMRAIEIEYVEADAVLSKEFQTQEPLTS